MAGLPAGRVTNDASNYLAFALQSAKDVDGTTFYFMKHLDGSGFDTSTDVSSERVGGSGREIGLRYRTKVTADGQSVAYAQPDQVARQLVHALGLGTDSVGASLAQPFGPLAYWTHNINSGGSQLPYVTYEQAWADEVERVTNGITKSLKFEGEAGKPVKVTEAIITGGTSYAGRTAQAPTRESGFPIMVPGGSVAITATGALTAGVGATSLQLTKWSLEVANTLDEAIQTVSLFREDVTWLDQDFNLDGTFKYINSDFWNAVNYGGATQVPTGLLTSGQFTFFSQTPSGTSLKLFCPFVEFPAVKVNRLDPDGKTIYIDYTAATRNIGTQSLQSTVVAVPSQSYALATT